MPTVSLTDRFVASAKPKGRDSQTDYFDEKEPGLALRVSLGGRKAWSFIYTSPKSKKRTRVTLGAYPSTSLASARTRALEAKGHLGERRDPRDVFAAQEAGAMTVAMLLDAWCAAKAHRRSVAEVRRRLERNVLPIVGSMRLADLHKRDASRVIEPIFARAPSQANQIFRHLRAMLNWGVSKDFLDSNPMAGMSQPHEETPRDRVLSEDEIRTLWSVLPEALSQTQAVQRIIKLCLLTAQRPGEVTGMRKSELDLKARLWSLPGARTKNASPHTVPLTDTAIAIIKEAIAAAGNGDCVFPTGEPGALPHINPRAVARTISRAHKPTRDHPRGRFGMTSWAAHDLRRTAITGLAQLGVQPIVIGSVANHLSVTKASVTFASYVRHDYAREKREALELWADRLCAVIAGGAAEIRSLRAGRA